MPSFSECSTVKSPENAAATEKTTGNERLMRQRWRRQRHRLQWRRQRHRQQRTFETPTEHLRQKREHKMTEMSEKVGSQPLYNIKCVNVGYTLSQALLACVIEKSQAEGLCKQGR